MTKDIVKIRVERILKSVPNAKNCDKTLILEYLKKHTRIGKIDQLTTDDLFRAVYIDAPTFETITRRRREIQREGRFPPTAKKLGERKAVEKAMRLKYR